LHEGNKEAKLAKSRPDSQAAYNRELIRYNTLYAKLITQYEMNNELVYMITGSIPDNEYFDELN